MKTLEDRIRADIEAKYGSVPKMASAIGVPPTTIYHALERGIENTTTKTRNSILEPLYGAQSVAYMFMKLDEYGDGERELVDIYVGLDARDQKRLLAFARAMVD